MVLWKRRGFLDLRYLAVANETSDQKTVAKLNPFTRSSTATGPNVWGYFQWAFVLYLPTPGLP